MPEPIQIHGWPISRRQFEQESVQEDESDADGRKENHHLSTRKLLLRRHRQKFQVSPFSFVGGVSGWVEGFILHLLLFCFSQSETSYCFGSSTTGGDHVRTYQWTEKQKDSCQKTHGKGKERVTRRKAKEGLWFGRSIGQSATENQNVNVIDVNLNISIFICIPFPKRNF